MSQKTFSNTEVPADKPADPYTATNKTEPELKEKVQDLVSFIESCKFGMMTTRIESTGLLTSRCMALAAKEGGGVDLLFHTNTESGKTNDLNSDPKINIAFLNPTGEWASVSGQADIITDRETVRKYYSPTLKAWLGDLEDGKHDGGPEDPRIGVIKVTAVTATYAIATGSSLGRGADIIKGTITGAVPKVNKLRELTEQELQQYIQVVGICESCNKPNQHSSALRLSDSLQAPSVGEHYNTRFHKTSSTQLPTLPPLLLPSISQESVSQHRREKRHPNFQKMSFSSLGNLVQQGLNVTSSIDPGAVLAKVTPNDQVTGQVLAIGNTAIEWLKHPGGSQMTEPALLMGNTVIEWVKHPEVVKYFIVPGAIFSTVSVGLANLGFGSAGIGAGTPAAAIQSFFYGGAVPAGGIFAALQSMAALGTLLPVQMGVAAGLAGSVVLVGWVSGVGS